MYHCGVRRWRPSCWVGRLNHMKHEGREWHRWACVSSIYQHVIPKFFNPFYDGNNPNDTIISIMFLGALGASGRPGGQHAQAGRSSPQWHCAPAPAWSEKNGGDESSARRRPNAHVFSTWEEGWPGWPPTYPTPKYPKCIRKFHVNSMRVHSLAFQSPAGNTALELPPAEYTNASANHQLELVLEISIYFCWWMDG